MVEPTLCLSLKTGLRLMAMIDTLISLAMVVFSILGIIYFEKFEDEVMNLFAKPPPDVSQFLNLKHLSRDTIRIFLGFSTFYWIQKSWLSNLLHRGAVQESTSKLKIWLSYTFLLLVLGMGFFLIAIILQILQPLSIPIYVGAFVVREYTIWTVLRYKFHLDYKTRNPRLIDTNDFTNF